MLGRAYTLSASFAIGTAAQDLFRLSAPADAIVVVDRIFISQSGSTTSEQNLLIFGRCSTDGTGTAATAQPTEVGTAAFGGTAVVDLSAVVTQTNQLIRAGWNALAPYEWLPTPEERIVLSPSARLFGRIDSTPTALTIQVLIALREIGG